MRYFRVPCVESNLYIQRRVLQDAMWLCVQQALPLQSAAGEIEGVRDPSLSGSASRSGKVSSRSDHT